MRECLKDEIEYDYFEMEMPDKLPFIDGLMAAVLALRREDAPENRRLLADIDSCVVLEFMEDMKNKSLADVRNYSAWQQKGVSGISAAGRR